MALHKPCPSQVIDSPKRSLGNPPIPDLLGRESDKDGLARAQWPALLEALGLASMASAGGDASMTCTLQLPSAAEAPLPSPTLARYWPADVDASLAATRPWRVDSLRLERPISN